ncbi:MAG: lipoprotein [Burkholderiales bacterium]|nr:lipoprotein [Burkholderiales bacterium]
MLHRTLIALSFLLLNGCGIQGALYLPPNAVNDSYITRLRKEFNDFIGTDSIGTAPEDNDTVIEVVDPKNFTIDGQPLEEQEGIEDSSMELEEGEVLEPGDPGYREGLESPMSGLPSEEGEMPKDSDSPIKHELPVRGKITTDMNSTETE